MIYVKTAIGQLAFQNRASMPPRHRSAFILFDGKRRIDDVLNATAGLGFTADDVQHLVEMGFLARDDGQSGERQVELVTTQFTGEVFYASGAVDPSLSATPSLSDQAHYLLAYPIATRLTAGLGLRGFRLNLAVEAAGDLARLRALARKIEDAVGQEKFADLHRALYD